MLVELSIYCLVTLAVSGQLLVPDAGHCSRKCRENKIQLQMNNRVPNSYSCSCSSSCLLYRDCCYDYQEGRVSDPGPKFRKYCLSLEGKGNFLAVGSCPRSWNDSSEFCRTGLGHLAPVTSLDTGTTYTNRYCAICNSDSKSVLDWSVDVKCDTSDDSVTSERFAYYRRQLWTVRTENDTVVRNSCWYKLWDGKEESLNKLEIRSCDSGNKISSCSHSWEDTAVRELCKSYLDPVFIENKVYRNMHCAVCNYERESEVHCIPLIVRNFLALGVRTEDILDYCKKRKIGSCIYYVNHSRGGRYTFSELLRINERTCISSSGNRCCNGYQYDFRRKRCRKLVN